MCLCTLQLLKQILRHAENVLTRLCKTIPNFAEGEIDQLQQLGKRLLSHFLDGGGVDVASGITQEFSIYPFDNYVTHTFWYWSLALISKLRKVIGSRFMRARLPGQMISFYCCFSFAIKYTLIDIK
jgi:hypothetical protein